MQKQSSGNMICKIYGFLAVLSSVVVIACSREKSGILPRNRVWICTFVQKFYLGGQMFCWWHKLRGASGDGGGEVYQLVRCEGGELKKPPNCYTSSDCGSWKNITDETYVDLGHLHGGMSKFGTCTIKVDKWAISRQLFITSESDFFAIF